MEHRRKAVLAAILIVLLGIFLPLSCRAGEESGRFTSFGAGREVSIVKRADRSAHVSRESFTAETGSQLVQGDLYQGRETEGFGIRQSGDLKTVQRTATLLWIFAVFSLCIYCMRVYLSYTRTVSFLSARFLCELITIQKKDGKKRSNAFC